MYHPIERFCWLCHLIFYSSSSTFPLSLVGSAAHTGRMGGPKQRWGLPAPGRDGSGHRAARLCRCFSTGAQLAGTPFGTTPPPAHAKADAMHEAAPQRNIGSVNASAFGKVLAAARKRRGLTQDGLARAAGCSAAVINKIECVAQHSVRLKTVRMLGLALNASAVLSPEEVADISRTTGLDVGSLSIAQVQSQLVGPHAEIVLHLSSIEANLETLSNTFQLLTSAIERAKAGAA